MMKTVIRSERPFGPKIWTAVVLIGLASLVFSRAFACAMPFAALAAFAAVTLRKRDAAALVLFSWAANQAVGFGLMHYPHTASTLGWGGAIGIAVFGALGAALAVDRMIERLGLSKAAVVLAAAFAAYEVVLAAAAVVLPSGPGAFAPAVVLRILAINAVALGLLLALHGLAKAASLSARRTLAASRG